MKKVVTVTLGSSKQDFEFKTEFLGQSFSVKRMGADDDTGKAWELMRRQQATADAIGLGEIGDHYQVGLRTVVNKETQRLLHVVTRVPVTTGATLRRLLQVRAVRYVQKELGHYFNNNLVLFLSGMRNYDMAVALSDYTKNLSFADALFQTGAPTMLTSLEQLELYAKGSEWMLSGKPGEMLEAALSGFNRIVVLDERGTDLTTVKLAQRLEDWMREGGDTAFIIGGADGIDEELKQRAASMIRLSSLTLPHAMARLVLCEQLYRAVSVVKNHPYHREG